ncbi:MAG: flagellar hook capping FlgD N-terminal domain-containing protein [Opitutaceae bacterium]
MSVSNVFGASSATDVYSGSGSERVPKKTLGQNDFFKLIATQFAAQDPLKPMEDTAFIAQLANFSALENSSQLVTQFEQFSSRQELSAAQGLLGRTVTLADPLDETRTITGTVTAVDSKDEGLFITVNGSDYEAGTVRRVELTGSTETGTVN